MRIKDWLANRKQIDSGLDIIIPPWARNSIYTHLDSGRKCRYDALDNWVVEAGPGRGNFCELPHDPLDIERPALLSYDGLMTPEQARQIRESMHEQAPTYEEVTVIDPTENPPLVDMDPATMHRREFPGHSASSLADGTYYCVDCNWNNGKQEWGLTGINTFMHLSGEVCRQFVPDNGEEQVAAHDAVWLVRYMGENGWELGFCTFRHKYTLNSEQAEQLAKFLYEMFAGYGTDEWNRLSATQRERWYEKAQEFRDKEATIPRETQE